MDGRGPKVKKARETFPLTHILQYLSDFVTNLTIEQETDRREGKGRRCCLGDVLECRSRH